MTLQLPIKEWWTAQEIADAALIDLPGSMQAVANHARKLDWRAHPEFARRRAGRGGGWEYHWRLFPVRAQRALITLASAPEEAKSRPDRGEAWAWFDGLPQRVKDMAADRLRVLQEVESLVPAGTKFLAVSMIGTKRGISDRTIWNWFAMVEGVDTADRLPYLAPRHRASTPRRERASCSPEFLTRLKAAYLRPGPSFKGSYEDVVAVCNAHGWEVMTEVSARRWFKANVPMVTQVYAREGEAGLEKCFPPQIRDRSTLTALEGVNADCHKIDVFVAWPGIETPVRPQIVAFQDLYSGKILSWRVDLSPNKVAVMSAFGELIETWGIPRHCLFDNGREFANKWLTGGAPTRFRFRVREDDPLGVLPQMGIQIHWATPGHGQAKPIERAFRDVAGRIALDPRFAGAYVGRNPLAKPEDYGRRAIPLDVFLTVLDEGIRKHNAREGRRSDTAKGRSFDETFAESYASAPICKATPEQHRLWLMGQETPTLHRTHGELTLHGNKYWADWMNEFAGQKVIARFDPENLHAGVYVYSLSGEFLGPAECREKVGFFDLVGAQLHARNKRQVKAAEKKLLQALRPMSVDEFAAELAALPQPEAPLVEAKVVELAPARVRKPMIDRPLPVPDTTHEERLNVYTADFSRPIAAPAEAPSESVASRFRRMLDIERRSDAGERITPEEAEEWGRMQRLPEFQAMRVMFDDFGDAAIG